MPRASGLDAHTLHVVRSRLNQIADARGSITALEIKQLISEWIQRDTDIAAVITAGRIRKLRLKGAWTDRHQIAFNTKHQKDFRDKVAAYLKRMDKNGSNRI